MVVEGNEWVAVMELNDALSAIYDEHTDEVGTTGGGAVAAATRREIGSK